MNTLKKILLFSTITLFLTNCTLFLFPGETELENADFEYDFSSSRPGKIAYIYEDEIYAMALVDQEPTALTSDSKRKSSIAISYGLDQVAYLETGTGTPVIIDLETGSSERLTQYTGIKNLGWTKDDQSLYMFDGDDVLFHGPSIELPSTSAPYAGDRVDEIKIAENSTVLIKFYRAGFYWGDHIIVRSLDSSEPDAYKELRFKDIDDVWLTADGKEVFYEDFGTYNSPIYWNAENDWTNDDKFDYDESMVRKSSNSDFYIFLENDNKAIFFENEDDIFFSKYIKSYSTGTITDIDYKI